MNEPVFQKSQIAFCHWLRTQQHTAQPTMDLERMQIYRELLFNNVCTFIEIVYPVTRALLPVQQWQALIEEFFQKAHCDSPFYQDISLQFREYLINQRHSILQTLPWLAELMQFEWLELYLDMLDMNDQNSIKNQQNVHGQQVWQLAMPVWVLVYQYPVYQWNMDTRLDQIEKNPSAVLVWRNQSDVVCCQVLSPLFAVLIEHLSLQQMTDVQLQALIRSLDANSSEAEVQHIQWELRHFLDQLDLLYSVNSTFEKNDAQ